MFNPINCQYFEQAQCHSCQWLTKSYPQQLSEKSAELKRLVSPFILQNGETEILPPQSSPLLAFRNKAKMVVSGSVERPILGIQSDPYDHQSAIDLCECPLYPTTFSALFPILKQFIGRAGLVPYNVAKKRGELKYILLTQSQYNQSIMLRFVLKSERKRPLVERELPALLAQLPPNSVVSLNIQPYHSAILEGEQEIFLTEQTTLTEYFNGIPLFIRPQGFFQTNPSVAAQLYATAQQWVKHLPITQIWDLFCGVGGFGLHCAKILQPQQLQLALTGIEISAAAIASASKSAALLNLKQVKFDSLDSTQFALCQDKKPDLVIVNPPRRGIGRDLADYLNHLQAPYLLYSSCNAQTMAKDFAYLSHYTLKKMQLFDMFPHTSHYEVLTFLERNT